ncbi:MAG: glycosyltransferase family 2 protein [Bacteroidales bacterium]|nr:glycosyltransferase family 2 protein [Bacteroidales bacterium]
MKISVIIPTYQPGTYLFECLDSLKEQNFPHTDFEILIILNGSQYPYENNIRNYIANEWTDITVSFIYTPAKGVSNARNMGIEKAKGEYVLFLDDDDLISSNYLKALSEYVSNDGIAVSNVKTFTEGRKQLRNDYLSKAYLGHLKTKPNAIFKLRSFLSTSCCKLIPTKIIGNHRFDTNVSIGEDSLFMFLLSDNIKLIHLCPEISAIYYRRLRSDSASRKKRAFSYKVRTSWELIKRYTAIYIRSISSYNFTLYISRVVAAMLKIQ